MTVEFKDAVRGKSPLLIILAGGTGSGKTESSMRLATGLSGGRLFAVIDTENGRALHKADDYKFKHADLTEPFTPERYIGAVKDAEASGYHVIVIDSGSHEYEGVGGVLEIQAEEFERMGGKDSARMASWIAPKQRDKRYRSTLVRSPAHIILCLRAEDKVEVVKVDGKTVVRPMRSLTGAEGWIPICEKRLPFEATMSFLLTAEAPGVPKPIKFDRKRHGALVPLDEELSEETGRQLAAWAAGQSSAGEPEVAQQPHTDAVVVSQAEERIEPASPAVLTNAQALAVTEAFRANGFTVGRVKELVRYHSGQDEIARIPADKYDAVLKAIVDAKVPA